MDFHLLGHSFNASYTFNEMHSVSVFSEGLNFWKSNPGANQRHSIGIPELRNPAIHKKDRKKCIELRTGGWV